MKGGSVGTASRAAGEQGSLSLFYTVSPILNSPSTILFPFTHISVSRAIASILSRRLLYYSYNVCVRTPTGIHISFYGMSVCLSLRLSLSISSWSSSLLLPATSRRSLVRSFACSLEAVDINLTAGQLFEGGRAHAARTARPAKRLI